MVDNPDRGDSYVPTTSAAVYLPRRGHHIYNGSAWVNEGIQIESEARTNLLAESNDLSAWTNVRSTDAQDVVTSPDGTTNANSLNENDDVTTSHAMTLAATVVDATKYTISAFFKAAGRTYACLGLSSGSQTAGANAALGFYDLSAGTAHTGSDGEDVFIENFGNGWYRCGVSYTTSGTTATVTLYMSVGTTNGSTSFSGDSTTYPVGIYVYGAQLEIGSTPSSYIPTAGATVTRAAETLTVAAANLPYSAVAMSIQMDGELTYADEGVSYQIRPLTWYNNSQNRFQHMIYTTGALTGEFLLAQEYLNVVDSVTSVSELSPGINVSFNYAVRHGATFINAAFEGAAVTENSTPTGLPDLSAAVLTLAPDYMGTIGKFRMWDDDLGDTGIGTASARTYTTEFAMIVATTTASETFTIPCQNVGTFNAVIDWGDNSDHSTITAYNDADLAHVYNSPGDHVIRITGTFPNIYFNNGGDKLKVKSVENFGEVGWTRADEAFYGCSNMTSFTSGTTDTSALLYMNNMFRACTSLTALDVSGFNTSSVINMFTAFYDCSSLTTLDVSSFNTALVTDMGYMFFGCASLTSLDVSGFNTALVTDISNMFRGCTSLTALDVSGFDTSSATSMISVFRACNSLTALDVSGFNTALVTNMSYMFNGCSSVTDIIGVDTFDISGLDGTGDLTDFATGVTLPTARYDALLLAWEAQDPFDGMAPNFGSSTYTGGGVVATAHASLISRDGWTITDGGIA